MKSRDMATPFIDLHLLLTALKLHILTKVTTSLSFIITNHNAHHSSKDFWNALSNKDSQEFYGMMLKFAGALVVGAPVAVFYR